MVCACATILAVSLLSDAPRLLVLTDIGGDPDDQQSLVRLLLYANEFEIEGLIASAAGTPGELKQQVVRPDLIRELIAAYGEVREHLAVHAGGYPPAGELLARIATGNPARGRTGIGEGRDTDGSRLIIAAGDKIDPRPLGIAIWGGQTDLAQALWRVRADRGNEGLRALAARLRIYDVADQDGIAGWIHEQFPGLFYIQAGAPAGRDKREGVFRGMYLGGDESLVSRQWMETNIRTNHGPLGALYPPRTWTAPNPHSAIKEGDTPSWLYFLRSGLGDFDHPEWGGFGGRFERTAAGMFRDANDSAGGVNDARATVWRWRAAVQADFQARLDWCVADAFEKANHPPVAALQGDRSRDILRISAQSGERVQLSAEGSSDPDRNNISFRWRVYPEASTCPSPPTLENESGPATRFVAPTVGQRQTLHIVLQATDDGDPPLSSFRRVIVAVEPAP